MWSLEKLPARLSKGFSARFSANCDNELGFERCYFQTGLKSFSQNFSTYFLISSQPGIGLSPTHVPVLVMQVGRFGRVIFLPS